MWKHNINNGKTDRSTQNKVQRRASSVASATSVTSGPVRRGASTQTQTDKKQTAATSCRRATIIGARMVHAAPVPAWYGIIANTAPYRTA